ncbi:hypothetical protein ACQ4PT_024772 [Festuca glaucescens]
MDAAPDHLDQDGREMAVGFRRRLATLTVPTAASIRRTWHRKLSYTRTRSASLPGLFHLVVAGLHDSANALLGWTEAPAPAQASTAWIADGVEHLERLLSGLTDLLHHPQAHDPLRYSQRRSSKTSAPWTERLLDDLLIIADAHGCFREALLSLKQLLDEAHAAVHRRDAPRLVAALRTRRRSDAPRLASAAIFAGLASASASSALRASASPTSASSPAANAATAPVWWVADPLRWRRRTVSVAAACESSILPGRPAAPRRHLRNNAATRRVRAGANQG